MRCPFRWIFASSWCTLPTVTYSPQSVLAFLARAARRSLKQVLRPACSTFAARKLLTTFYATLCYAMLRCAVLCYAMLRYAMLCYSMPHATAYYAGCASLMLCYAIMLCCARYATLCMLSIFAEVPDASFIASNHPPKCFLPPPFPTSRDIPPASSVFG